MIWHAPGAGTPRAIFCPSEEYHILLLLYLFKFNFLNLEMEPLTTKTAERACGGHDERSRV